MSFQGITQQESDLAISAVPGIPDLKSEERKEFTQGLERFIDAMRGKTYAAVILAEPLVPRQLQEMQAGYEQIATTLSVYQKMQMTVGTNESESLNQSLTEGVTHSISESISHSQSYTEGKSTSVTDSTNTSMSKSSSTNYGGIGMAAGAVIGTIVGGPFLGAGLAYAGQAIGGSFSTSKSISTGSSKTKTTGNSKSTTEGETNQHGTSDSESRNTTTGTGSSTGSSSTLMIEQQNKSVARLIERIDQHLKRMDESRAFGTWNASCYLIAPDSDTARIGASLYSSILRGGESGVEDYSVSVWNRLAPEPRDQILSYLKNLLHPRMQMPTTGQQPVVTPASIVTGKELALMMNLPRKSVSGVTVLDGVPFGREIRRLELKSDDRGVRQIEIGRIRHLFTTEENTSVHLNVDNFVYHTLVTGTTGTGKTTAVKSLVSRLFDQKVPFLVIEPAKQEYASLKGLSTPETPVTCLQAGRAGGDCLRLNPLVFPQDGSITLIEHVDRVCTLFNAAFPMYAAMPQILEEAIVKAYENKGWDLLTSQTYPNDIEFPTLREVVELIPGIVQQAGYENESRSTYIGALTTRLNSLTRGALGITFMAEARDETPANVLFDRSCVVNLSSLGSSEKRAVLMGLLMVRLQEYRISQGQSDQDTLRHVMVLEEAHNLLKKTSTDHNQESSNPQGQAVEYFSNALAEMRAFGEGFVIVDQSASALDVSVLRNTNTKIAFRAPFEEDRKTIGGALALNEEQTDALARIENHTAIIKQSDWLEAIQCHIRKDERARRVCESESAADEQVNREYSTLFLHHILGDRRPRGYLLPSLTVSEGAMKTWLKSLPAEDSLRGEILKRISAKPIEFEVDRLGAMIRAIPLFDEMVRTALQCNPQSSQVLRHMAVRIVRELTLFTDPQTLDEIIYLLLITESDPRAIAVCEALRNQYL
jgi:hypothetical protein